MIPIIVLAAGGSARLGQPKQLVPYKGTTLIHHAAATALAAESGPVIVVLGAGFKQCAQAIADLPAEIVVHGDWAEGIGSTIAAGVRAARRRYPGLDGAIVMACDQPLVDAATLRALGAERAKTGRTIVACEYAGTLGIPALFAASELHHLERLEGDQGAKRLLLDHRQRVGTIDCAHAALDVDVPADLDRL